MAQTVKASVYNAGDPGSIPGLGRSLGEGNGNPLQDYCLENPMDRGVQSLGWEDPLERKWQSTPGLLPGKSHGLVVYSPRGRKELDTTERLHSLTHSNISQLG